MTARDLFFVVLGVVLLAGINAAADRLRAKLRMRRHRQARDRLLARLEERDARRERSRADLPLCDGSESLASVPVEAPTKVSRGAR